MIIEEIVARLEQLSAENTGNRHLEKVYLPSDDLVKRIQRVVTDHGRELGISLRQPMDLSHGDVLYMDDHNMIVVEVLPEDILVIQPRCMREMGDIAHKLGNRHLPAQFESDRMLIQYDYLIEEMLVQADIPYLRETMKVSQPFRHIGHSHG
ncbi:urease accessory protein UreE [Paenibacillus selenitireducens]|uniref:Urease accessory protein UreE n=1 Tax=Paenibacillus selenitireducens TaxID=1324314 RepID=A0A1T2X4G7_9BACL|nr:urease accessory protein UreE [Paenibacillus selenitireducens]OPA74742.1 urease accessory protein UreE [Paenibacillus selenitireducens]